MKKLALSAVVGLGFSLNSFAFAPDALINKMCGNTKTFPIASKVCIADSLHDPEDKYIGYCEGIFMTGDEPECTLSFQRVTGIQKTANTTIFQARFKDLGQVHRQILRISNAQDESGNSNASLRVNNAYAYGGQFFSMSKVEN